LADILLLVPKKLFVPGLESNHLLGVVTVAKGLAETAGATIFSFLNKLSIGLLDDADPLRDLLLALDPVRAEFLKSLV